MSHGGGGGSKKCGKSVTYYLNGPLDNVRRGALAHGNVPFLTYDLVNRNARLLFLSKILKKIN